MYLEREEKNLIDFLQEIIFVSKNSKGSIDTNYRSKLGFMLSYFLKAVLEKNKDSQIKEKWLDFVEWKSLDLINSNTVEGIGLLWWGFRDDKFSTTFPEDFYCKLELNNTEEKKVISYLLQFKIDKKNYELKN
jgi:hypothetical protein